MGGGGCCAARTPSPCWSPAARPLTRRDSSGSWPISRRRWRQAASACPMMLPAGSTDALAGPRASRPAHNSAANRRSAVRQDAMSRFFFYGTLLDRDVMALVLGRLLPPQAFVPASLLGHARRRAKGASYPVVVRDPRGEVAGAIVGGLSARDVTRLTVYEGPGYRVVPLRVRVAGSMTTVSIFEPVQS